MDTTHHALAAWGKTGGGRSHPLLCHALDTAAVADRILPIFLGPVPRGELVAAFAPLGDPENWISTLCGLHDLGKASPAFQGLKSEFSKFDMKAMRDVERVRRQVGVARRVDTPHGIVSDLHFRQMLRAWGATAVTAEAIAGALGGHHGYFANTASVRQAEREINNHGGARWEAIRENLARQFLELRGLPDPTGLPWGRLHVDETVGMTLAALTTLSDWIASDVQNFPFAEPADLGDYARQVVSLAGVATERLRWTPWQLPKTYLELFPSKPPPHPVQSVVEALTVALDEPALMVIEAPTGEGKTYAAFQAAAALSANTGAAGTYIAMPTRATGFQTFGELNDLLREQDDPARSELIHAAAAESLATLAAKPTGVGEDDEQDLDVRAQSWFTRKKSLLAPVAVGTVDQALKGVIRSGHVFVRLVALTNKIVIVDEVHAYDTYMSTLLDRLLEWLGRMGVGVVLLSATLPRSRRDTLVAAWQSGLRRHTPVTPPPSNRREPYPRVTLATKEASTVHPAKLSKLNRSMPLLLKKTYDGDVVPLALAEAAQGRVVAIVHNLVRRASSTHAELARRIGNLPENQRPELHLITGRLAAGQRKTVETRLVNICGKNGSRPAAIIVGTQVLEQGLDLDFDSMLTDLAPVDSLIQRVGRLHRFRRGQGRAEFVLRVTGVEDTEAGPAFPRYLDRVYARAVLLRTWAVLRGKKSIDLPADVPDLIDAVYDQVCMIACPGGWEDAWRAATLRLSHEHDESNRKARLMYVPHPAAISHLNDLTAARKNPGRTRKNTRNT